MAHGCNSSLRVSLHSCCRNRWDDKKLSVKTFVCELQIHHQVSDAARRDMCVSVTFPPKEMLPSKVLDFWLKQNPGDKVCAEYEEFHERYVKMRDVLAS